MKEILPWNQNEIVSLKIQIQYIGMDVYNVYLSRV